MGQILERLLSSLAERISLLMLLYVSTSSVFPWLTCQRTRKYLEGRKYHDPGLRGV